MKRKVVIVGGGIIGAATAYKLLTRMPALSITILEKEDDVAAHQTGHNSGVVHAGLYYKPGSQKALLCTQGRRELLAFCAEQNVPHEVCGKLVVATSVEELPRLDVLLERGRANGLQGLRRIGADEAAEFEPHVRCVGALVVPDTGIVDFAAVTRTLARVLSARGVQVVTGARVERLERRGTQWRISTTAGSYEADHLVTCAGLHADRVARMAGARSDVRIVPFRGDYFTVAEKGAVLVRNLIYPVPNPLFPFLGVHVTRTIHGHVHVGPSAALALSREGYGRFSFTTRDAADSLAFKGLWRFLVKHPRLVMEGLMLASSRRAFVRAVHRLIPALQPDQLQRRESGVRAQAMDPSGALVDDFLFVDDAAATHVLNAPSPAATAGFAIGDAIAARVQIALETQTRT